MVAHSRKTSSNVGSKQLASKVYAVAVGRGGPRICKNSKEFHESMQGFPGASGKGFPCLKKAQEWLSQCCRAWEITAKAPFSSHHDDHAQTSFENMNLDESTEASVSNNISSGHALSNISNNEPGLPEWEMNREPPPLSVTEGPNILRARDYAAEFGIHLAPEQRAVLKVVDDGRSVFFTGAAGTGKSITLRAIIKMMRAKYVKREYLAVTASTGIAALNIGGETLHSFAGVGLGKKPLEKLLEGLRFYDKVRNRWKELKTLIIDEISMTDGHFFDKLEAIARSIRANEKPFGGIQIVICGDFFQLPPVPDQYQSASVPATFAFDALSWRGCINLQMRLTKVFRQEDSAFVNLLNRMRIGQVDEDMVITIQHLARNIEQDGILPVQIYPLNAQVMNANTQHLDSLTGSSHSYEATDRGRWNDIEIKNGADSTAAHAIRISNLLDKYSTAPRLITLKEGAQVMLTKNLVAGRLVNGSLGRVACFATCGQARMMGVLSAAELLGESLSNTAAADQASKKELRSLERMPIDLPDIPWPVVEFTNKDRVLFTPMPTDVEDAFGDLEATRIQITLILAWAITVHKSQGQTIERLKIDFEGTFENGQAYVAMSRSTGLPGLQVINFKAMLVRAHPRVLAWHKNMLLEEEMDEEEAVTSYFSHSDL